MFANNAENNVAASKIQRAIRQYLAQKSPKSAAARKIQRAVRRYLAHKSFSLKLKVKHIGKGIVSTLLSMKKPSMLFGEAGSSLDVDKMHEVLVTRVHPSEVSLQLSTNQGTPDSFKRHLTEEAASYGAMINGGFYAINGFYGFKDEHPIGLHRFINNFSFSKHHDALKSNIDNTQLFFKHDKTNGSNLVENHTLENGVPSDINLKTQTPDSVKEYFGCMRIDMNGDVHIAKLDSFDEQSFSVYLESAKYLLTSGPMLVWNNEVLITENLCQSDVRFQYKQILARFGSHPGSIPPGTFYHADQLNPRSAIGLTSTGELLFVTVKGEEEPSCRDGMTLDQFALLMKLLGAKTALNLDGGFSACQGIYNQQMIAPFFLKKAGREKLLPCSIVAKEKVSSEDLEEPQSKRFCTELKNTKVRRSLFQN